MIRIYRREQETSGKYFVVTLAGVPSAVALAAEVAVPLSRVLLVVGIVVLVVVVIGLLCENCNNQSIYNVKLVSTELVVASRH